MERPKTIGVNNGFLTWEGKLLLQIRTTESWMGKVLKKSYKGLWELNGGRVEEEDIFKALTLPVLKEQAVKNAEEKLGISMTVPEDPAMYLTVFKNEEKGMLDWAIMFPIPPAYWRVPAMLLRNAMLVDVAGLNYLANRPEGKGQLVSGYGKRQHRMGLAALLHDPNYYPDTLAAYEMLNQIKPDWQETEYSENAGEFLKKLREEIK